MPDHPVEGSAERPPGTLPIAKHPREVAAIGDQEGLLVVLGKSYAGAGEIEFVVNAGRDDALDERLQRRVRREDPERVQLDALANTAALVSCKVDGARVF